MGQETLCLNEWPKKILLVFLIFKVGLMTGKDALLSSHFLWFFLIIVWKNVNGQDFSNFLKRLVSVYFFICNLQVLTWKSDWIVQMKGKLLKWKCRPKGYLIIMMGNLKVLIWLWDIFHTSKSGAFSICVLNLKCNDLPKGVPFSRA